MSVWPRLAGWRPCQRLLQREREELRRLRQEHKQASDRVIRNAEKARFALTGISIILAVEDVDHLFERKKGEHD
jgi:RNA:NAD 2'-phosphotransferase (TPT1/KptA family)